MQNIKIVDNYCYLGLNFHKSGNFVHGINTLSNKASNAYHSWFSAMTCHNNTPPKLMEKVFDTTISPVALYGSEIWGAYLPDVYNNKIPKAFMNNSYAFEKLNIWLCKNILGVRRYVSNHGAKAELGRLPLLSLIIINVLKYYVRLHTLNEESLAFKALMFNKSETDTNYINSINHISNYLGIKELAISNQTKKFLIRL